MIWCILSWCIFLLIRSADIQDEDVRIVSATDLNGLLRWNAVLTAYKNDDKLSEAKAAKLAELSTLLFQTSVLSKVFTDPSNFKHRLQYEDARDTSDLEGSHSIDTTRKTLNGRGYTGCSACPWFMNLVKLHSSNRRCADLGCGLNSQLMLSFLMSGARSVTLLDESASHIAAMLLRCPERYHERVEGACCTLPNLPTDREFDLVTIVNVLHFMSASDITVLFERLAQRLARDGLLLLHTIIRAPGQRLPSSLDANRPFALSRGQEHEFGAHIILPCTIHDLLSKNGMEVVTEGMMTADGMVPFDLQRYLGDMSITVYCILARLH